VRQGGALCSVLKTTDRPDSDVDFLLKTTDRPDSDVDFLVEFEPDTVPGQLGLAGIRA
jgi:predicted nucleotidyltransferase